MPELNPFFWPTLQPYSESWRWGEMFLLRDHGQCFFASACKEVSRGSRVAPGIKKKKSPMCIVSLEIPKCDLCFPLFHITTSTSNQMKFSSICQSAKMMETHILWNGGCKNIKETWANSLYPFYKEIFQKHRESVYLYSLYVLPFNLNFKQFKYFISPPWSIL